MVALSVSIPAKINLHLRVLGRRSDGFHELRTLFQSVDLRDCLTVYEAKEGVLELEVDPAEAVSQGDDNLVIRAAKALQERSGRRKGARLFLEKRIPVGGGLGGGSADAAAALVVLNEHWSLDLAPDEIADIAAVLGSDVPFFLCGGTAFGVGRGEKIEPFEDLAPVAVAILAPSVEVSTAEVFSRLSAPVSWAENTDPVYAGLREAQPRLDWAGLKNDLAESVCSGWPEVGEALRSLRNLKSLAANVTGSGAAVFAVFEDIGKARASVAGLDSRWRIEVVRTLTRNEARPRVAAS